MGKIGPFVGKDETIDPVVRIGPFVGIGLFGGTGPVVSLTNIIELLGETRIIRIILLIIIIRAGTPLVSHSCNFNWKPKYIDPKIQYILDSS